LFLYSFIYALSWVFS